MEQTPTGGRGARREIRRTASDGLDPASVCANSTVASVHLASKVITKPNMKSKRDEQPSENGAATVGCSLDHLIGTWTDAEADEIDAALEDFETVDKAMRSGVAET